MDKLISFSLARIRFKLLLRAWWRSLSIDFPRIYFAKSLMSMRSLYPRSIFLSKSTLWGHKRSRLSTRPCFSYPVQTLAETVSDIYLFNSSLLGRELSYSRSHGSKAARSRPPYALFIRLFRVSCEQEITTETLSSRSSENFLIKNVSLCAPRLRGVISEPCFTRKPEGPFILTPLTVGC